MIEVLNNCRKSDPKKNLKSEIINTILIILLGICLGVFSKTLDNISINDEILWQKILGIIDLRNVFSRLSVWALLALGVAAYSKRPSRACINVFGFFVGIMIGYYTITLTVSGFFPKTYMIAWLVITLFTPILAIFAWYAKGHGWLAILLSSITAGFFITQAFSCGIGYFHIKYYPECIFLIIAIAIMFRNGKQLLFTLAGSFIVTPIINKCLPYIF